MSARRDRGQGSNPTAESAAQSAAGGMNLSELKEKSIPDLNGIAREMNIQNVGGLRKQELIFKILQSQAEKDGLIYAEGVLEVLPDGFGVDETILLRLRLEDLEDQLLLAQAADVLDVH